MVTKREFFCSSEDTGRLSGILFHSKRIMLWGEMGIGKSTLALQLLPKLDQPASPCQLIELDPGSPLFGIPGTVSRGWLTAEGFNWGDCQALCTLNSARFRLPLVLAAGKLLAIALSREKMGSLLIDPPGVVRGVGGAELLIALTETLHVDAVVVMQRENTGLPLATELGFLNVDLVHVAASPASRLPAPLERLKNRTQLWNDWLQTSRKQEFDLENLSTLGTPPPLEIPDAWEGRQAALLNDSGETLALGEILHLEKGRLTARLRSCMSGEPVSLLVRDSGRDGAGRLASITPAGKPQRTVRMPAEMGSPSFLPGGGMAPVSSHLGSAWATLVGGVFGDPLLHVRLRRSKTSFLFDLGDPSRLMAKIAHQVKCVFLSHAHLDHIGGFLWFLRSRIGPFPPCRIFGPADTINRLASFIDAITWDRIEESGPIFEVGEINGDTMKRARLQPGKAKQMLPTLPISNGGIVAENDYSVRSVICDHHTPSIAYSFELQQEINVRKDRLAASGLTAGPWLGSLKRCVAAAAPETDIELPNGSRVRAGELIRDLLLIRPGKKLVYVTDIADTPENYRKVISLARSAHTLFCETAFTRADGDKALATQHLTTSTAIRIARDAGVQRLVPFHFSKRYERDPGAIYDELSAAAGPVQILGQIR